MFDFAQTFLANYKIKDSASFFSFCGGCCQSDFFLSLELFLSVFRRVVFALPDRIYKSVCVSSTAQLADVFTLLLLCHFCSSMHYEG